MLILNESIGSSPSSPSICCLHYQLLPQGVNLTRFFRFLFHSSPTVDSLPNKKQMGDFCCRQQPNGAKSHYSACKLCISLHLQPVHHFAILCVHCFNLIGLSNYSGRTLRCESF